MKTRLLNLWEALSTSLWLVPTLMAVLAVALSFGSVALDAHLNDKLARSMSWLWSGGPDGARSLLSTIAGSMMTVTGVVFSITMVTLTLASSQFGSRLLRNFMRDRGNQITLGTFISTFVYCLLVLRTVRSTNEGSFVPYLSVTAGVALALVSLGVLIYFIHHVAGAIQAESLTASVGAEFQEEVARLCEGQPTQATKPDEPAPEPVPTFVLRSKESGYLLSVDRKILLNQAREAGLRLRLICLPGDFVLRNGALAEGWMDAGDGAPPAKVDGALVRAFSVGAHRTPTQDIRYSARQLVEIASRALSPGINDPFTAIGCLDWLAAGLAELAARPVPSYCLRDEGGQARLWGMPVTFPVLAERTLELIRGYAEDSVVVTGHLLKVLGDLGRIVERPEDRAVLRELVTRVKGQSDETLATSGVDSLVGEAQARVAAAPERKDGRWMPAGSSMEI